MADASLDELLAPEFLDSLELLSIEDLRQRRSRSAAVEVGLSYARRLVQGHLDILLEECHRRETGRAPTDTSSLVDRLPEILADRVRAPGNGRMVSVLTPVRVDDEHLNRVEAIIEAALLVDLPSVDDAVLSSSKEVLFRLERDVSDQRRALHEVMDRLQQELIRRYKAGEVTVESLLE